MATLDISTEYQLWDNVETLSVSVREGWEPTTAEESSLTFTTLSCMPGGGTRNAVVAAYGLRIDPTSRFSSYNRMAVTGSQASFWLPVAEIGSVEPTRETVIEDTSGQRYSVDRAMKIVLGSSASHWDVLVTRFQEAC